MSAMYRALLRRISQGARNRNKLRSYPRASATRYISFHAESNNGAMSSNEEDLFRYTSGSWLCNDHIEKSRRYIRFNVEALGKIAAKACDAEDCVSVKKIAEGSFNRVFCLTFNDGREAIARLPFPMAGPPHLLTASEVATLDFVRNVMSIPAPKVLAWSSRAASTPVGAEFMILEKIDGIELYKPWPDIKKEFGNIIGDLIRCDRKFATTRFSANGSLFYKEDIVGYPHTTKVFEEDNDNSKLTGQFAIGPHMAWELWYGERVDMDIDRGPWNTATEYITGFIRCHQEWLRQYAQPRFIRDPSFRSVDGSTPNEHIDYLDRALSATLTLQPSFQWPVLWHPDLHRANIFVKDAPPFSVTGLIDWQYAGIGPFYAQICIPKAFQYTGTRVQFVRDCLKPPLPDNFDSLSEEEKKATLQDRLDAGLHVFYERTTKKVPNAHVILTHEHFKTTMQPFWSSPVSWLTGLRKLQLPLASLYMQWDTITDGDVTRRCPFQFSEVEWTQLMDDRERFLKYEDNVDALRDELGCSYDGWVPADAFGEAFAKSRHLESEWDEGERGGPYPFRDGYSPLVT